MNREFARIDKYLSPLAHDFQGALGLKEDAAFIEVTPCSELVVSSDMLVSGVHFLDDSAPEQIAAKSLRVNLSDLASMGATPLCYQLMLSLPKGIDDDWFRRFAAQLHAEQRKFNITLSGGDYTSTPGPLTIAITVMGQVPRGEALLRRGAQNGDLICVSGPIGNAACGLRLLQQGLDDPVLTQSYFFPEPRLDLACQLRRRASAVIDISDGLVADLGHICKASGHDAHVDFDKIPLSPQAKAAHITQQEVLAGGDDYELVVVIKEDQLSDLPLHPIGRIVSGQGGVHVFDKGSEISLAITGWVHP